jgi:polyisoprenoid-binding protein YceI
VPIRKKLFAAVLVGLCVVGVDLAGRALAGVTAATTYRVDSVHSTVIFRVKHMNASYFNGRFDGISGTVTLDEQNHAQSAFDLKISASSVDTANPKRDGHIKSPDFLNAAQFPTIAFKSKSVSAGEKDMYEVQGDLTLHGVTRPITLKVTRTGLVPSPRGGGSTLGLETVFTIKRSEFGMTNMLQMLGDEITITADLEASGS